MAILFISVLFRNAVPVIDYLIQYNEDDYQFISKLLRRFGLFNYFIHHDTYFEWIICDNIYDFPSSSEYYLNFQPQTFLNINSQSIYNH